MKFRIRLFIYKTVIFFWLKLYLNVNPLTLTNAAQLQLWPIDFI